MMLTLSNSALSLLGQEPKGAEAVVGFLGSSRLSV